MCGVTPHKIGVGDLLVWFCIPCVFLMLFPSVLRGGQPVEAAEVAVTGLRPG